MKKFINISAKQFIKVVLPLLIVAVFTITSYTIMINKLIDEIVNNATGKGIERVEKQILRTLDVEITNLDMICDIAALTQAPSSLSMLVKSAAAKNETVLAYYFSSIKPLSKGGYLVMSDDWRAPSTFDQTTRPWYSGALEAKGQIFGSDIYVNARSNTKCISLSRAIYNERGTEVGVVGFDMDLEKLSANLGNIQVSPTSVMNIVTADGRYVTHYADKNKINDSNIFDDTNFSVKDRTLDGFVDDGETKVVSSLSKYFCVGKIPGTPWYIVVQGERNDFVKKHFTWGIIILIITAILILVSAVFNVYNANITASKERALGEELIGETQNLVVVAKETSATSQDQSAAVKEIVATMEDTNNLSENIAEKIQGVTSVAQKTSSDVADGASALNVNVDKLYEISEANKETIDGIKELSKEIDNIWDIVTMITSVADQAKIIAFNAELEAASAGEAGKNFHIVASEIRRLADGIIDSTKEIKDRISAIQHSSDSLILASESGTVKVAEGVKTAKELEERFASIKSGAEITAQAAEEITTTIQQQTYASSQILITLKQISAGVENFSATTENVSSAAAKLQEVAEKLNVITKHSDSEEAEV